MSYRYPATVPLGDVVATESLAMYRQGATNRDKKTDLLTTSVEIDAPANMYSMKNNLFTEGLQSDQGVLGIELNNRTRRSTGETFKFTTLNVGDIQTVERLVNTGKIVKLLASDGKCIENFYLDKIR